MKRHVLPATLSALAALVPGAAWSMKAPDLETFDDAPAGLVQPGQVVDLEHFRVETALGTSAIIKRVAPSDELASGLALGAIDNGGPASVHLSFNEPRRRVDFTVVMPPSASTLTSVAILYDQDGMQRQALTIQHSTAGHRMRLGMSVPNGTSFSRLSLQLQAGAYVDGVEMTSPLAE